MFYTWIVGEKEFKLKLTTLNMINLEKKMGCNPLDIFLKMEGGQLPTMEAIADILHHSLQAFNHGFTLPKVYELLDEYFANDGTVIDLMPIVMEIFKVSGFFKKAE